MSGTPTVGSSTAHALQQLHRLMQFLREPTYGISAAGTRLWAREVARPAKQQHSVEQQQLARHALLSVLQPLMVRHTKADLQLPPPHHVAPLRLDHQLFKEVADWERCPKPNDPPPPLPSEPQ